MIAERGICIYNVIEGSVSKCNVQPRLSGGLREALGLEFIADLSKEVSHLLVRRGRLGVRVFETVLIIGVDEFRFKTP